MAKTFYITTAIDYTNAAPHIGHAYEKILADVIARYQRLKTDADGNRQAVFFLTGVDQHGQKVQQSAEKQGVAPQQFVDEITAKFRALWKKLEVDYDDWAATTDDLHKKNVRANLQILWDDKDPATGESRWLYKKKQRGFYSVRQEQFLTDKERNEQGEFGPEWQPVEEREEENFYFRLTRDRETGAPGFDPKQWLLDFIDKRSAQGKPFVVPDFRVAELRNAVEKLEGDLCISRPASRLKWGIPFPENFGAGFVTYVWFDALLNYLSFVPGHDPHWKDEGGRMKDEKNQSAALQQNQQKISGEAGRSTSSFIPHPSSFADLWPALHVIGKDILIPAHGVYWPIMLKAFGFSDEEIPTLLVHGWWNIRNKAGESEKMSKTLGNVVDPNALADKYGAEALRYYLMSDIATGKDADFSEERLVLKYNTDLANSLGNLLNRTLNMVQKYREGALVTDAEYNRHLGIFMRMGQLPSTNAGDFELPEYLWLLDHAASVINTIAGFNREMDAFVTNSGLELAIFIATRCNTLVDRTSPWKMAKDSAQAKQLAGVLYHLAESLRIIAILISPVLPKAARGIFDQLNWHKDFSLADATWGGLPDGHIVGKPTPLFPRIDSPSAE